MRAIIISLLLANLCVAAEKGTPDWIVESFFKEQEFPEKEKYYTGEMLHYLEEANMGSRIPPQVTTSYRIIDQRSDGLVYAVDYAAEGEEQNWYCFIKREDELWKLQAVRQLALPGFFYMLLNELHEKSQRSEEEEWEYQNMLLQVESDTKLKNYLKDRISEFESLRSKFLDSGQSMIKSEISKENVEIVEGLRSLHLSFVTRSTTGENYYGFCIGGIMDNSVGYIYLPEGTKPPEISAENYIYLEQILPHWYIYKTT